MTELINLVGTLLKLPPSQLAAIAAALFALYQYVRGRLVAADLEKARLELFKIGLTKQQAETDALLAEQNKQVKEATDAYKKALADLKSN